MDLECVFVLHVGIFYLSVLFIKVQNMGHPKSQWETEFSSKEQQSTAQGLLNHQNQSYKCREFPSGTDRIRADLMSPQKACFKACSTGVCMYTHTHTHTHTFTYLSTHDISKAWTFLDRWLCDGLTSLAVKINLQTHAIGQPVNWLSVLLQHLHETNLFSTAANKSDSFLRLLSAWAKCMGLG